MTLYIEVVSAATETASKILARRAARAWTVKVTCNGGSTASVSWDYPKAVVNMPSLPPDSVLTRAEADRLVAYVAHECCHVLHTQWDAWLCAVNAGPRVRQWTNALEDVRIEAKEIRAGAFPALRDLLASLCDRKHYEAMQQAKTENLNLGTIDNTPYAACILGRLRNKYPLPCARDFAEGLSPGARKLVDHALARLGQCRTTMDVYQLAQELVAMEQAMQPQPQPQPGQGKGDDASGGPQEGQEGDDASGGPQEGQEGDDASGGPQEGQEGDDASGGPQEGQEGDDASGGPQEGQEGQDGHKGAGTDPTHDLATLVRDIARRAGIDDLDRHNQRSAAHVLNTARTWIERHGTETPPAGYNQQATASLNGRLPGNSVLHGQISRLLVSDEVHRRTHHETSGQLDRRALVRMRAGAVDVFSRRDDTPGIDTALLVLVDGSTSMELPAGNLTRMQLAQVAAWNIAKAAEGANAKVCVIMFRDPVQPERRRMDGATLHVMKDWHQSCPDTAFNIADMRARGGTPLSQSIVGAAEYLREQSASRWILLTITDGECNLKTDAVRAACNIADALGVETVGLGMACPRVIDAFPPGYSEDVQDLAQLANKGMAVLTAMLEDANPRGAD